MVDVCSVDYRLLSHFLFSVGTEIETLMWLRHDVSLYPVRYTPSQIVDLRMITSKIH